VKHALRIKRPDRVQIESGPAAASRPAAAALLFAFTTLGRRARALRVRARLIIQNPDRARKAVLVRLGIDAGVNQRGLIGSQREFQFLFKS